MTTYRPLYAPPIAEDIEKLRKGNFASTDQELYLHIGHFVSWYGAAEYLIGILLRTVTKTPDMGLFHILTRGMDATVKVERLRQACREAAIVIGPNLDDRLTHFTDVLVPLRNKLVHSHLYWPEGKPLQICTIGAPPIFEDMQIEAADPEQMDGLTIFERGVWLNLFAHDVGEMMIDQILREQKIEIGSCRSPLPTGHHPSYPRQSARAKRDKLSQKPGPIRRAALNARRWLRKRGLWKTHKRK